MKKLIAMLLACVMVLGLVACGNTPAETTAAPDAGETTAAEKSGCGSVIGFGAVAILAAAAAAVALKKD